MQVRQLEHRHVELTAARGDLEERSRSLQNILQQSQHAREQAEAGLDKVSHPLLPLSAA